MNHLKGLACVWYKWKANIVWIHIISLFDNVLIRIDRDCAYNLCLNHMNHFSNLYLGDLTMKNLTELLSYRDHKDACNFRHGNIRHYSKTKKWADEKPRWGLLLFAYILSRFSHDKACEWVVCVSQNKSQSFCNASQAFKLSKLMYSQCPFRVVVFLPSWMPSFWSKCNDTLICIISYSSLSYMAVQFKDSNKITRILKYIIFSVLFFNLAILDAILNTWWLNKARNTS